MQRASDAIDQAAVLLPNCASYLVALEAVDLDKDWELAVNLTAELLGQMSVPARAAIPDGVPDRLRKALVRLRRPFETAAVKTILEKIEKRQATSEQLREVRRLLDSPLPSADDRASLWAGLQALEQQLADGSSARAAAAPAVAPAARAARLERFTRDLLRLAGVPEPELPAAAVNQSDAAGIARAEALRMRLSAILKTSGPDGTRLVFGTDPADDRWAGNEDPAAVRLHTVAVKRALWLAERFSDEAAAYDSHSASRDFFRNAADAYRAGLH
jgi:hypothetical protein